MTLKQKIQPITEKKKSLKKGTPEQWDQCNKLIQQQYKNKYPTNYNELNEMIKKPRRNNRNKNNNHRKPQNKRTPKNQATKRNKEKQEKNIPNGNT